MTSIKDERGFNQGFKKNQTWWVRSKRRWDRALSEMELKSEKKTRVLEIGCSTGEMCNYIAQNSNFEVLGIDISKKFIKEASNKYQRNNLSFQVKDFNKINDFANTEKFDYIIGDGILHHLYYSIDNSLESIRGLLKDGGKVIFWEPNLYNPYVFLIFKFRVFRKLANLEFEEMAFTSKDIKNKLRKVCFRKIKIKFLDFLLPVTPKILVGFFIYAGDIIEKMPFLRCWSQSIFIVGIK